MPNNGSDSDVNMNWGLPRYWHTSGFWFRVLQNSKRVRISQYQFAEISTRK
jgi:hypothetical protein